MLSKGHRKPTGVTKSVMKSIGHALSPNPSQFRRSLMKPITNMMDHTTLMMFTALKDEDASDEDILKVRTRKRFFCPKKDSF